MQISVLRAGAKRKQPQYLRVLACAGMVGLAAMAIAACDDAPKKAVTKQSIAVGPSNSDDPQAFDAEPGSPASAAAVILSLRDATLRGPLTESLRAKPEDYVAVYGPEFGPAVQANTEALWGSGKIGPGPWGDEQTETVIVSAKTEEFATGEGQAKKFPSGYKRIAEFMQPGLRIFQFRYVRPGEKNGASWDGLVHVNGRWRIMPKPWRAAAEGSAFHRETPVSRVCTHLKGLPDVDPQFAGDCAAQMGARALDYGDRGFQAFAACAQALTSYASLGTCQPQVVGG